LRLYWNLSAKNGAAIFTTQNRAIVHDQTITSGMQVEPLDTEEGASMLLSNLKQNDDQLEVARQVSKFVAGLPLALAQIVGYVQGTDDEPNLSEFLEEVLQHDESFEVWASGQGISLSQYPRNLLMVIGKTVQALPEDARYVLDVLSMLDSESIPEDMLQGESGIAALSNKSK
jgi:hypothetical protein